MRGLSGNRQITHVHYHMPTCQGVASHSSKKGCTDLAQRGTANVEACVFLLQLVRPAHLLLWLPRTLQRTR